MWDDGEERIIAAWALVAADRDAALARIYLARFGSVNAFATDLIWAAFARGGWPAAASMAVFALERHGDPAEARRLADAVRRTLMEDEANGIARSEHARTWAELHVRRGDRAAALLELERAIDSDWQDVCAGPVWIGTWPPLRPLRGERRFEALLERCRGQIDGQRRALGLPPARLP